MKLGDTMKKNIYYFIFFVGIFFLLKIDAYATTCNYNISGYSDDDINWTLDTSNGKATIKKALASSLYDRDEELLNWDSSDYPYNTKEKTSNGSCPEYLIQSMGTYCAGIVCTMTNRMFAADSATLSAMLSESYVQEKTNREVHVMQLAKKSKVKTNGSACKYKGDYTNDYWFFEADTSVDVTLNYNGNGELLSIDSSLNTKYSNNVMASYSLYNEKIANNTCNSSIAVCQNSANSDDERRFPNYTFYLSGLYKTNEDKYDSGNDRCISFNLSDDSTDKDGNKVQSSENCGIYDTFWNELEATAKSYKSCYDSKSQDCGTHMKKFNDSLLKMQTFCDAAYQSMTYTDSCVRKCVKEFDINLAELKQENGIGTSSNNAKCGLSARLANWIMKIVNWMRYIVPVLLILLSVLDFIKAIAADSEDEIKKVTSKFVKRLIVAVIIFLVPLLLEFLLGIFGIPTNDFCL